MVDQGIKLVYVVHVMLHRRALALQFKANPMWHYKPDDEVAVQH